MLSSVFMNSAEKADLHERRRRRIVRQSQTGSVIALLVMGVLVGGIFYLGSDPAVELPDDPFFPGQLPGPGEYPGQELFAATCAPCHGVTAGGNTAAGIPALNGAGDVWMLTGEQIETIILDGTPKMPGNRALLGPAEVGEIIEFLQVLWTEEQREAFQANN